MVPRLYLISPDLGDASQLAAFAAQLPAALEAGDVACLLLHGGDDTALQDLRQKAQDRDVAVLRHNGMESGNHFDGIHLDVSENDAAQKIKNARQALGKYNIIGASCGHSRHCAMVAGEAEADYVAFGAMDHPPTDADLALLSWWQDVMEPPCVGLGATSLAHCRDMASNGADFVALGPGLWQSFPSLAVAVGQVQECFSRPRD